VIVILGVRRGHVDEGRSKLRREARTWQSLRDGRMHSIACESGLKLLVGSQGRACDGVDRVFGGQSLIFRGFSVACAPWMSGKKNKPHKPQPPAQPDAGQRRWDRNNNTHVRGEIEVEISPSLATLHNTERREDTAHERKKFRVEIATFLAVLAYAGLTFWQGGLTRRLATTAEQSLTASKEQFRSDQRPYVWANARSGNSGKFLLVMEGKDAKEFIVDVAIDVINSGRSPAVNMTHTIPEVIVGPTDETVRRAREFTPHYPDTAGTVLVPGEGPLTVARDKGCEGPYRAP
jgi:hypothetical protein